MRIALNGMLLKHLHSGVEVSILNLARALAGLSTQDYVLYVPGTFPEKDIATDRFRTRRAPSYTRLRPVRILWEQFILPVSARRAGIDLLHAPGYIAPLGISAPVIITIYDLIALSSPQLCKRANALNYAVMLPLSIRKAAGIIVPSEATRSDLLDRFPAVNDRIEVIPLGISPDLHPVESPGELAAVRTAYQLPEKFILFTGRQEPKKNLARLIDAFHILRTGGDLRHKLVLAGTYDRDTPAIRGRVAALGLTDDVLLPGFVRHEHLAALYSAADLFVFPSLYEGFGLPPLEAMACGTPVTASNRGAVPEVTGDAAILVDPTSPAAIADGMKQALTDTGLRQHLIDSGFERAARYTWDSAARATESLYTRIATAEMNRKQRR